MPSADRSEAAATFRGVVEIVTFHAEDTGYCVLKVKPERGGENVTVLGNTPRVVPGELLEATGEWIRHREFGRQFKAQRMNLSQPASLDGLTRYLGSGLVDGIGPTYAKRIVQKFGTAVLDIIENESARLEEVEGVGKKRRQTIRESWMKQKALHGIMIFLHQHGIGAARALRIYKTYGSEAMDVLQSNPYRLAEDIHGIGFKSADVIAGKMGLAQDAPQRIQAGLTFSLSQGAMTGHCCLPRPELVVEAGKHLQVSETLLDQELDGMIASRAVIMEKVEGQELIFQPRLHHAEQRIARRLKALAAVPSTYPEMDATKAMAWWEKKTGKTLGESQRQAVSQALQQRVLIITGGPGVGKTTILNAILAILSAKEVKPILAAPTGRAAQRLAQGTGFPASTLHRLLEYQGESLWGRTSEKPLQGDLFVVDEASMIDAPLMAQFLNALPPEAHLLLVGDADQLPSVGPGAVLQDIIASGEVPVNRLTQVFRQAAESRIITAAHDINQGHMPDLRPSPDADFFFLEREGPEAIVSTIVELAKTRLPGRYHFDPLTDIQVLCPMNQQALGTRAVNQALQEALNPPHEMKYEVERFQQTFRTGDKVIQTRNNYEKEVFNGDIGHVSEITTDPVTVRVTFEGRRQVIYEPGELDELQLAYAITIHKSQGSEFPCVIIPWSMAHFIMLERSLIYTGVTRGKKLVIIAGDAKALAMAVRQAGSRRRYTTLRERLVSGVA